MGLFLGLSHTGKTLLYVSPERTAEVEDKESPDKSGGRENMDIIGSKPQFF